MSENYWLRNRVSRRGLLRGGAAGAVGASAWALVGCGDDDAKGTATKAPASGTAAASATTAAAAATTAAASAAKATDGSYYSAQGGFAGTTMDMHRELYRGSIAMQAMAYNSLLKWGDVEKGTYTCFTNSEKTCVKG